MIIKENSIKFYEANLYSLYNNEGKIMESLQRSYSYKVENIEEIAAEVCKLASFNSVKRAKMKLFLNDFILYEVGDKIGIADGHSRWMTFDLLIRAVNNYIIEHRTVCKQNLLQTVDLQYEEDAVQKEYANFLQTFTTGTYFGEVYKYFYEVVSKHSRDLDGIIDVIQNRVMVIVKETEDPENAYEIFQKLNTGGKPLTKTDIIHSTLKHYSKHYGSDLDYNVEEIESIMDSYYSILEPTRNRAFAKNVIMSFLKDRVVNTEASFLQLRTYLNMILKFKNHPLYPALKLIEGDRVMKVAYGLMAKETISPEYVDIRNYEDKVNTLLMGLMAKSVVGTIQGTGGNGKTWSFFESIMKLISIGTTPDEILKWVKNNIESNPVQNKIQFDNLTIGLDNLRDNTHKAIMLLEYFTVNNCAPANVEELQIEHAFSRTSKPIWVKKGWPDESEARKSLVQSIGNKFLIKGSLNASMLNDYLDSKGLVYEEYFNTNRTMKTPCNYFDAQRYEQEHEAYAYERRKQYANFIKSLPLGKNLIKE